jgi:HEPN domain-containing protein
MKDETRVWLEYAKENLKSSKVLLESKLYNPCLQNIQQSVEKAIKAILIEKSIILKKHIALMSLKTF